MKSRSARLLAVRRVTQDNQGKKTAGIDGVKSVQPTGRLAMVEAIHPKRMNKRKPKPLRRVWIPKPGKAEQRPLGIPVMFDRACQALAKAALEPQWEAKFEANSYGFRPGRGAHDAIGAIFSNTSKEQICARRGYQRLLRQHRSSSALRKAAHLSCNETTGQRMAQSRSHGSIGTFPNQGGYAAGWGGVPIACQHCPLRNGRSTTESLHR